MYVNVHVKCVFLNFIHFCVHIHVQYSSLHVMNVLLTAALSYSIHSLTAAPFGRVEDGAAQSRSQLHNYI